MPAGGAGGERRFSKRGRLLTGQFSQPTNGKNQRTVTPPVGEAQPDEEGGGAAPPHLPAPAAAAAPPPAPPDPAPPPPPPPAPDPDPVAAHPTARGSQHPGGEAAGDNLAGVQQPDGVRVEEGVRQEVGEGTLPSLETAHTTQIPTHKWPPKASRVDFSRELADLWDRLANNMDSIQLWTKLLIFPRCIIPAAAPRSTEQSLAQQVKARLRRWRAGECSQLWQEAVDMTSKQSRKRAKKNKAARPQQPL